MPKDPYRVPAYSTNPLWPSGEVPTVMVRGPKITTPPPAVETTESEAGPDTLVVFTRMENVYSVPFLSPRTV